jgi:ComF family protein
VAGILTRLGHLSRDLCDFFYPPACLICNSPPAGREPLCGDCRSHLTILPHPVCPRCRRYLEPGGQSCPAGHRDLPSLLWASGLFDAYYRKLIHAFKFHGRTDCGEFLADRLATAIAADPRSRDVTCVMPVPLHSARRRERGFNQSRLLAARIAVRIDRPLVEDALHRLRNTATQTQLTVAARRENVAGAFALRPPEPLPESVLLVDDVLTTGATLAACAAVLRDAGVSQILGAVAALAE